MISHADFAPLSTTSRSAQLILFIVEHTQLLSTLLNWPNKLNFCNPRSDLILCQKYWIYCTNYSKHKTTCYIESICFNMSIHFHKVWWFFFILIKWLLIFYNDYLSALSCVENCVSYQCSVARSCNNSYHFIMSGVYVCPCWTI